MQLEGPAATALLWFCIVSILLDIVLIVVAVTLALKIGPLVREARDQIKRLGDKGNEIATTAKATVERVHDRSEQILGSAQNASAQVTQRIGAASTALTAIFVVLRIFAFARGMASPRTQREAAVKRIKA